MLSKKMAFSLSIITIFAFALVVSSAMAGDFGTSISIDGTDISHADKEQRQAGTSVTFNVKFDKVVAFDDTAGAVAEKSVGEMFEPADIVVRAYDEFGAIIPFTGTPLDINAGTPANGQNFQVIVTITAEARTVYIQVPQGTVGAADPTVGDDDDANAKGEATVYLLPEDTVTALPTVYKIALVGEPFSTITTETFQIHVLLSEEPKDAIKDIIDTGESTFESSVELASPGTSVGTSGSPFSPAVDLNGDGDMTDPNEGVAVETVTTTKTGDRLRLYLVTLKAKEGEKDVLIKMKSFANQKIPTPGSAQEMYIQGAATTLVEGRQQLSLKTKRDETKEDKTAGIVVYIPENTVIPEEGYLVVAKSKGDSAVRDPGGSDKTPAAVDRQPFGLTYNLVEGALPNLEVLLSNGGTIDIIGPEGLIISEIMWGSDASLEAPVNSQYVELRNPGEEIKAAKEQYKLVFYGAGATLPTGDDVQDRVGTVGASGYWSVAGIGQSGRTGIDEAPGETIAIAPTQALISMQRGYEAATLVAGVATEEGTILIGTTVSVASNGTMMSSWSASEAPGVNFDPNKVGIRIGSPGREPVSYPTAPDPEPDPTPVAEADDIAITEIMVDTSDGRLPQWIELTNISGEEKSLAGWSLIVMNAAADDAAVGSRVTIDLSGTGTLGVGGGEDAGGTLGKSLLLVAWDGRNSRNLEGNERIVDVSDQVGETGRYTLISEMAFMLALMPPQETSVIEYGDTAGNLGAAEAWEIPTSDGPRSSLIRREALEDGMATMGTSANGWILASDTSLVTGPATWYGSDEDAGTPGYDGGGPLPVELSHFRPARDKATGAVVITWSTQSELNNAGFFIKRSNQQDGQFQIINAAMIPGAGTTSEKQFYTYTDTTAQPNIVYYYQIEDVSLDGNRQTLTNGIRLKGHIGAAGKLTTTWGDLKTSNE